MLLIDEVKKLVQFLLRSRMMIESKADESVDDIEMSSAKYAALNSKLRCIIVCAKSNMVYPDVESNYQSQGMQCPTAQQIMSMCIDCLNDLCNAAGDLVQLREVENKHRLLLKTI